MQDFDALVDAVKANLVDGGVIYICGNGGSAAQADHFAGELVCDGIPCISLNNMAAITATANDFGYQFVFSEQLRTLAGAGDILLVLTTSCKSKNILNALHFAKHIGMLTVGITGNKSLPDCDYQYKIPSNTQAVQELTLIWLHILWKRLKDVGENLINA